SEVVSADLDSFGLGTFSLVVEATDAAGNKTTGGRTVTVTDDDAAGPTITLGGSTGRGNDSQDQKFTWNVSDTSGLSALSVTVKKDGSPIFSTTNTAKAVDSFDFNSYGPG